MSVEISDNQSDALSVDPSVIDDNELVGSYEGLLSRQAELEEALVENGRSIIKLKAELLDRLARPFMQVMSDVTGDLVETVGRRSHESEIINNDDNRYGQPYVSLLIMFRSNYEYRVCPSQDEVVRRIRLMDDVLWVENNGRGCGIYTGSMRIDIPLNKVADFIAQGKSSGVDEIRDGVAKEVSTAK